MIMRKTFCITIILCGLVLIFSCSQDPVFFTISTETAPVEPHIPGSPTNMVVFNRNGTPIMYVASGSLHWYANAGWDSPEYNIPQPGGKVIDLAATRDHLYALRIIDSGARTELRRIGHTENVWEDMEIADPKYTLLQSIYADPGTETLFAGAMNGNDSDFGIFYLNNITLNLLADRTELLSGAASPDGNVYYLSTWGKGIYRFNLLTKETEQLPGEKNRLFKGMLKLDDTIIAVERDGGEFFEVQDSGFRKIRYSNGNTVATDKYATGALALWQQNIAGGKKMLIAGIQGVLYTSTSSSYTHGYVEFDLEYTKNSDGWLVFTSTRRDNTPNITVDGNTDRYTATIGKHPINHFFQAPPEIDANMTFFASTQTNGLWSYRDRKGGPQWNAEGENEPILNINE
jgi:hypothetical protein